MNEFPEKLPGDDLEASHVNDLSAVARKFLGLEVSGGLTLRRGAVVNLSGRHSWWQYQFIVTGYQDDGGQALGLCVGSTRWWDEIEQQWKTEDNVENLDASDTTLRPSIGDKVVAYWDKQRGQFVPISGGSFTLNWFQISSGFIAGGHWDGSAEAPGYWCLANPVQLNPATMMREDPTMHWDADLEMMVPSVGPSTSMILYDASRQVGAWQGDFLQATDTGTTHDIGSDTYAVWEVTNRLSAQLVYPATLLADLTPGNVALAAATINGFTYTLVLHCAMLTGLSTIKAGETCFIQYLADSRRWEVLSAPCYAAEG